MLRDNRNNPLTLVNQSQTKQSTFIGLVQEVEGELDIATVMNPWLYQMGLPVVNITVQNGNIRATQSRFLNNPEADPEQPKSVYG